MEFTAYTLDTLYQPGHPGAQNFLNFLNDWTRLTTLLNEMSRRMGQPDFYPFVLPHEVIAKLHFIHLLVTSGSWMQPDNTGQSTGLVADAPVIEEAQNYVQSQLQNQAPGQMQGQ